ncbi:MAG: hypothetical protein H5T43_00935 [Methanomethylovorans sp.]|jgi:hypothetical protein|nr:hypothetical protein [Methanomethylovorans sp.]
MLIRSTFFQDERGWIDFFLSKTALILASVVVIAAIYHFALNMEEISYKKELDRLSAELLYYIDNVGSSSEETCVTYAIDFNHLPHFQYKTVEVLISCEYVIINANIDGKSIIAAKAPAFRVYPYSPSTLSNNLKSNYGSNGSINEPIRADYADIIKYLTSITKEVSFNTSNPIYIQKTFIYFTDDINVDKIGYVLVYQR